MSTPYLGEVRLVGFNFAPVGWNYCDGTPLNISIFTALYTLLGTTYGGDGVNTFNLPDLRGRIPIHQGTGNVIGSLGGIESVTLTTGQMPAHIHGYQASSNSTGNVNLATGNFLATGQKIYTPGQPNEAMYTAALTTVGGSQPHENRQPYQVLNWIIALEGIYPTQ